MKKLVVSVILWCFCGFAIAQVNYDSVAYQLERNKINMMLAQRAQKFGQYDESLTMHTGIFGLQTKKDIRRSSDILMDIVRTDDSIYKELKLLLEYRNFQQAQVQNQTKEAEESNLHFMATINKLRLQLEQSNAEATKQQQQQQKATRLYILVIVIMLASILYLLSRKRNKNTDFLSF